MSSRFFYRSLLTAYCLLSLFRVTGRRGGGGRRRMRPVVLGDELFGDVHAVGGVKLGTLRVGQGRAPGVSPSQIATCAGKIFLPKFVKRALTAARSGLICKSRWTAGLL